MDSIGERLVQTRQGKRISIEQASQDTFIAQSYIKALEQELYDDFPSESYFIGFLRKYSAYLELDSEEIVLLFKNTKLQERPSPVVELLSKKPKRHLLFIVIFLIITSIVVAIVVFPLRKAPIVVEAPTFKTVIVTPEVLEQEFDAWTLIQVDIAERTYTMELREITTPLRIYKDDEEIQMELDDVVFIDFDDDTQPDLRVVFTRILENGSPVMRIDKIMAGISSQSPISDRDLISPGASREPSREKNVQQIATLSESAPFFIETVFQGPVLFRYLSDGGERVERFYTSGDRFQLEVVNYVYIWLSNAGKLRFTVNGQSVSLGTDGSVAAYQIVRSGRELDLIPLY